MASAAHDDIRYELTVTVYRSNRSRPDIIVLPLDDSVYRMSQAGIVRWILPQLSSSCNITSGVVASSRFVRGDPRDPTDIGALAIRVFPGPEEPLVDAWLYNTPGGGAPHYAVVCVNRAGEPLRVAFRHSYHGFRDDTAAWRTTLLGLVRVAAGLGDGCALSVEDGGVGPLDADTGVYRVAVRCTPSGH